MLGSKLLFTFFISIFCYASLANASITHQTWIKKALRLQREIDLNAPLKETTFLGTHNSFNAKSYAIPLVRYMDPNQLLSIEKQLDIGIRSLEFDAHWTYNSNFSKDILLCHAQSNHLGCGTFDRKISEGLQELRDWLQRHPQEIVILYIERILEKHEPRMAALLDEYLGHFIFKPSIIRQDDTKNCLALPSHLSKTDILKNGKQLIVIVRGCDGSAPHYEEQDQFKHLWNDYVFAGIGDIPTKPYRFLEASINDFLLLDCGKSIFSADDQHNSLWRIYEDRTVGGSVEKMQKKIEAEPLKKILACGVNWLALDMLDEDDLRLYASVWSWAPTYPQKDQGKCALYEKNVGIKNIPCTFTITGYACQEEKTHQIKAISLIGQRSHGEINCQTLAGKNWHFATPVNAHQMAALKTSMDTILLKEVWLNYFEETPNHWKVGLRSAK